MTRMRPSRRNQRDQSERRIVEALRDLPGCQVILLDQPADLLIGYRGSNLLIECKTETRPGGPPRGLTPAEAKFFQTWTGQAVVVTDADQAIAVVRGLK